MSDLQIEDFGSPKDINSEDLSKEEIEKYYREQIEKIKNQYEKKLNEYYEKGLEEGFKKAKEEIIPDLENQYEKKFEEELKKYEEKIQTEFSNLQNQLNNLIKDLHEKYKKHIQFIDELILSVVEEMLYYLYINPENAQYVVDEIRKIIEDVGNVPEIIIEVSPQLKEYIKSAGKNVRVIIKENLEGGDFNIKIENTQFENRFKEKLEILKDEIKREIKKNTPL